MPLAAESEQDDVGPSVQRRGRPRSERAREAILEAAGELLLGRGLGGVSMDAVAKRAGVSKATIYRWWPSKAALVVDALYYEWGSLALDPDTGSLRDDLLRHLRPWVRRTRGGAFGRVVAELAAAAHADPTFREQYQLRFVQPRRTPARMFFARAAARGEIPPVDADFALDLVLGPIYHRLLHLHAPLTQAYVEQVVDAVLGGLSGARLAGQAALRA